MVEEPISIIVWDENLPRDPASPYPDGLRGAIADGLLELGGPHVQVQTAHLDEPDQGLPLARLTKADVLIWWGHTRHAELRDDVVARIVERVHEWGLGFIGLHSAHYSKPFRKILSCAGHLKGGWDDTEQSEELHVCAPHHPIAHGIHDFTLAKEELYGAPFDVAPPAVVVLQSFFPASQRYFPSGLAWTVGAGIKPQFESGPGRGVGQGEGYGRVFYFRPGHETVPTFFNPDVRRVIYNAVRWVAKRT